MILATYTTRVVVPDENVSVGSLVASVEDAFVRAAVPAGYPVMDAVLAGKAASEVGSSAGRADGSVAEGLVKLETLLRQFVNVGRHYLGVSVRSTEQKQQSYCLRYSTKPEPPLGGTSNLRRTN